MLIQPRSRQPYSDTHDAERLKGGLFLKSPLVSYVLEHRLAFQSP